MNDSYYMRLAIDLAKKGAGYVNPDPLVGAVLVKEDKIIGSGYHEYFGGLHAERNAINNCFCSTRGATLYVTLEPCCHYGKTPPCTDAIIEAGISEVIIGTLDINPLMSGKSVDILKQHGIKVKVGVLEDECKTLIRVFKKFITKRRPFVTMKYAMTLDGKIATYKGESQWISCETSRMHAHSLRHSMSAIMVGVNTVIKDDPLLNCRMENGKNPIRVICDTNLSTPLDSQLVNTANDIPLYIATCCRIDEKIKLYTDAGCKIINVSMKNGHTNLSELMDILGSINIDSILLEGGAFLNWNALKEQIVDDIIIYIAPKIFGGNALSPVEGIGFPLPSDAIKIAPRSLTRSGDDFLLEGEVIYQCSLD